MNNIKKIIIVYPLMFLLILSGLVVVSVDTTFAAESFDVSHGTKWVQGQNIDSGLRIRTSSGDVAYCLNQGAASPSGSYADKVNLSSKLKAVLYYGYPNSKDFGSISLTADQARCATQLAVWAYDNSGKGNKIDLDELHGAYDMVPDGDEVLRAAKWLYRKAGDGYSAPEVPTFPKPQITQPANKTAQFFNSTYVRVGPYRFTTTENDYTRNNNVIVDLTKAPTGARLGNSSGTTITKPTAGTDFYVYIPSANLTTKGSKTFDLNISYDFQYEKKANFDAYGKESYQNVAVSVKKEFTEGTRNADVTGEFSWTTSKPKKVDSSAASKVIPNTEFNIYYDPTPTNTANNDWIFMYKKVTDTNGVITIPGLGIGTYKLVETRPNPEYAFNSEFGKSNETIFRITDVSTESVQVLTNNRINISCQVDKDTIRRTSAAYKSLPNQEGFDNTKNESYRYHVDYRSTSNVWADEFVVDDHLEGVNAGQIRVFELWTPICYGDYNGKMNIWYKTNKTDDEEVYSAISAVASNPNSPNNPDNEAVKKNTGYKLWAQDVATTTRTNLKVSDLGLEEDEYITALRLEHGRVERGFTTRNGSYESLNDDSVEDWTPTENSQFYAIGSKDAEGLKPLTYIVTCPNPLAPPELIENSAKASIARNIHLIDDDEDEVFTEVIDSFKEEPKGDELEVDDEPDNSKVLGQFEESKPVKTEVPIESKTKDDFKLGIALGLLVLVISVIMVMMLKANRKKEIMLTNKKHKMLSLLLAGLIGCSTFLTYSVASAEMSYAESRDIQDSFVRNGLTFTLVKAQKINSSRKTMNLNANSKSKNSSELKSTSSAASTGKSSTSVSDAVISTNYKVEYMVKQNIDSNVFDSVGEKNMLPQSLNVNVSNYDGVVSLSQNKVEPLYVKKQAQVDRREVLQGLDVEDINGLPLSKVFTVRSDQAVDATVSKELRRAGVSLKVSGRDDDGIPSSWDATIVYRGLETYLEKYKYDVVATYSGEISHDEKTIKQVVKVDNKPDVEERPYNELNETQAKERNQNLAKERYIQIKDNVLPKNNAVTLKELNSDSTTTGDIMRWISGLLAIAIIAVFAFVMLVRIRRKRG